jgi:hypothetical protein
MSFPTRWRRIMASCWLLFGCDYSSSSHLGSAGSASGGGSAVRALTCHRTSECTGQVCGPDGRCVDCYDARDCKAGQLCANEHCVAEGSMTAGSGGQAGQDTGGAGGGPTGGGVTAGAGGAKACTTAQLMFVIQRSGSMFEQPTADASYWDMVRTAFMESSVASEILATKVQAGVLFFVRVRKGDADPQGCPVTAAQAPEAMLAQALPSLFDANSAANQGLESDGSLKLDAPVPEAIAAATQLLQGPVKHLLLITTGLPDSCTHADSSCAIDPTIHALQASHEQGIATHVLALGTAEASEDYARYVRQLANAGSGNPVEKTSAVTACGKPPLLGAYSEASGSSEAYFAHSSVEVRTSLEAILQTICP